MMRAVAILRPEPGASATAARLDAIGMTAFRLPLFAIRPVAWQPPPVDAFDCLLLSSANAVRHGGAELGRFAALPVLAVGEATAEAARDAGFEVAVTGTEGVAALGEWAAAMGFARALHLAGRDRVDPAGIVADRRIVYASERIEVDRAAISRLRGAVALVHSPRAGAALADVAAELAPEVRVAAISAAALAAVGGGWAATSVAAHPSDAALVEAARGLAIDRPIGDGDKAA